MADSSVPITAGSGTPIRVLTALGAASADQQVVTLADQTGAFFPQDPDGTFQVASAPTTLLLDAFDQSGLYWLGFSANGGATPAYSGGQASYAAGTAASGYSSARSAMTFQLQAQSYLQHVNLVQFEAAAVPNSTRIWGYGSLTSGSSLPVVNGVVFMLDPAAGALMAAVYSAGTRTQSATLTRPTDGAFHRYAIWFRQSRVYYSIDGAVVGTFTYPNMAVSNNLGSIVGSFNSATAPSTSPVLNVSSTTVADGGGNNHTISDGVVPSTRATIKSASTAAAATDTGLVVALHPSSPLPTGGNTIGSIAGISQALPSGTNTIGNIGSILTAMTPGTAAANLGKQRATALGGSDVGVAMMAVRAPTTPGLFSSAASAYSPMQVDGEGKVVTAGTADPSLSFQAVSTLTTTTAAAVRAAQGAGIRSYVTDLIVSNSSSGSATLFTLLDGATVIWQVFLPVGGAADKSFITPLRGTAATALNANLSVASSSVYLSLTGYSGI